MYDIFWVKVRYVCNLDLLRTNYDALKQFVLGEIKRSIRLNPNILMTSSEFKPKLYYFVKMILYVIVN